MKIGKTAYVGIGISEEYYASRKTRAEFCRERGMAVTTLDYYLRRDGAKQRQKLVPVEVVEETKPRKEHGGGMTLVLTGKMRIELGTDFDEGALSRLIALIEGS